MKARGGQEAEDLQELVHRQASFISAHQLPSGAIPWYRDGITDPWDQVECALALDLAGRFDEAAAAYRWLGATQNPDGSWWSGYLDDRAQDLTRDSNGSSYIAAGMWHHYLATGDLHFLRDMWPTVERGIAFALALQQPSGEVLWARNAAGATWPGALLAASSCIWQSIRCGLRIAAVLGRDRPDWEGASRKLAAAIREHPELFDRFGEDEEGYAMSWYYPVLCGVIGGEKARERLLRRWADFVIEGWGCKCVLGSPWVTVAETCELSLALASTGEHDRAAMLLDWALRLRHPDGSFWTGIKVPEQMVWPEESTTWTSAAVIMAVAARGGRASACP